MLPDAPVDAGRGGPGPARPLPHGDPDRFAAVLAEHPFTTGLDAAHVRLLAEGAGLLTVEAGRFVFRQGSEAGALYLITEGDVDLEVSGGAGPALVLESLHAGDALGWSWLFPGQPWLFDAYARTPARLVVLDGAVLRARIDADAVFGREIVLRVAEMVADRVRHARLQIVDSWTHERTR